MHRIIIGAVPSNLKLDKRIVSLDDYRFLILTYLDSSCLQILEEKSRVGQRSFYDNTCCFSDDFQLLQRKGKIKASERNECDSSLTSYQTSCFTPVAGVAVKVFKTFIASIHESTNSCIADTVDSLKVNIWS